MGICIDVKQAHKRCRIKSSAQGFLGFTWQDELYFFRCCPFGAVFSQHWWGRIGSCTLRLLHTFIFWVHMGLLFVDDLIFCQAFSLMPPTGALLCLFLQVIGLPVTWKKLQSSCRVDGYGGDYVSVRARSVFVLKNAFVYLRASAHSFVPMAGSQQRTWKAF